MEQTTQEDLRAEMMIHVTRKDTGITENYRFVSINAPASVGADMIIDIEHKEKEQ